MTHGQQAHLVALDGRRITTAQLFAMNEKWHRGHDEVPVKVETRRPAPRDARDPQPARERVEDEAGLLALALKRHGGRNPFLEASQ